MKRRLLGKNWPEADTSRQDFPNIREVQRKRPLLVAKNQQCQKTENKLTKSEVRITISKHLNAKKAPVYFNNHLNLEKTMGIGYKLFRSII